MNLLRYFFLKTQTAFVPFGFSGLGQRSNVASLNGNVNLNAGRDYVQTASNVLSNNDVNITAQTITLNTADNQGTQHADDKALKVGAFARVSSPIIDLVNNVEAARKSDGRLQAMQGMAAAAQAYQTVSAAQSGKLVSAEVGVGVKCRVKVHHD